MLDYLRCRCSILLMPRCAIRVAAAELYICFTRRKESPFRCRLTPSTPDAAAEALPPLPFSERAFDAIYYAQCNDVVSLLPFCRHSRRCLLMILI